MSVKVIIKLIILFTSKVYPKYQSRIGFLYLYTLHISKISIRETFRMYTLRFALTFLFRIQYIFKVFCLYKRNEPCNSRWENFSHKLFKRAVGLLGMNCVTFPFSHRTTLILPSSINSDNFMRTITITKKPSEKLIIKKNIYIQT